MLIPDEWKIRKVKYIWIELSIFSHKLSQLGHGGGQETFAHISSLNKGVGGGTGFYNKSTKIVDESNKLPSKSNMPF